MPTCNKGSCPLRHLHILHTNPGATRTGAKVRKMRTLIYTQVGESPEDGNFEDRIRRKALRVPDGPQLLAPPMFDGRRMSSDNCAMGSSMGQVVPVIYSFFRLPSLFGHLFSLNNV
ncbi:hypothetical protein Fot_41695 [Forsythia ovata]|uniref:Uncharacterized protein n=1 Tax=Forsythia ovata TaxID=205694 RepID=A0ABD1RIZ4_9LAMI